MLGLRLLVLAMRFVVLEESDMANISKVELMEIRKQRISEKGQKLHESWSSEEIC